jgi:tetratricopeptide (TPR) repeat protein
MNLRLPLSCFLICSLIVACSPSKNVPYLEEQFDKAIYYNDNWTAICYLHEIMALEPENNTVYTRLTDLYYNTGNFTGCIKTADIALKKANDLEKKDLYFAKVRSYKALGEKLEAIAVLDTLITMDKERDIEYTYETAVLYFEFKDLSNAQIRMERVMSHPTATQAKKELRSDLGVDQVSYYLAASNFIGYIKIVTGELEAAEQIYQEILRQTKEFKLANNNIILLEQEKLRKAKSEVSGI